VVNLPSYIALCSEGEELWKTSLFVEEKGDSSNALLRQHLFLVLSCTEYHKKITRLVHISLNNKINMPNVKIQGGRAQINPGGRGSKITNGKLNCSTTTM
jgi:hypothetical protein